MRNYATAVAIIDGLENVIVRQVPVSITLFHNLTVTRYNQQDGKASKSAIVLPSIIIIFYYYFEGMEKFAVQIRICDGRIVGC